MFASVISVLSKSDDRRPADEFLPDADLVTAFLSNRDDQLFEIIVRRYQDNVFRMALSILGQHSPADAEDATQKVFIALYRHLGSFEGKSKFSTWLYGLARNQVLLYARNRSTLSNRFTCSDQLHDVPEPAASSEPGELLEADLSNERMMRHINSLSVPQREAIQLQYWYGYSMDEIADILGQNASTIKSHLLRARRQLGVLISKEMQDDS
jgi:RNA polymerase sigma-70 factor (ECF subfamily)